MLREETDFIGNAIGIDPDGCGCTDCIVGNSFPEDHYSISEVVKDHFENGRRIINRSSGNIIMYKNLQGEYKLESVAAGEVNIIPESLSWDSPEEGSGDAILHSAYCRCWECEEKTSIPLDDEENVNWALYRHLENGEPLFNKSGNIIIAYQRWDGEYRATEISLYNRETGISLLPCD